MTQAAQNTGLDGARSSETPTGKGLAELAPPDPPVAVLRVLLIEDNLVDARLIQIMVSDAGGNGFEIERADRLAAALERLGRERFDIVLLDLSLPDSHGLETFVRADREFPNVRSEERRV